MRTSAEVSEGDEGARPRRRWLAPRRLVRAAGVLATIAAVAGTVAFGAHAGAGHKKGNKRHGGGVTAVQVATARSGTATAGLTLGGQVTAQATVNLSPASTGRITSVSVTPGQQVAAGAILANVTSPVTQAQLAAAQAGLVAAQAKLQAVEVGPTPQTLAVDQAQVAKAQATLAGAQLQAQQAAAGKGTVSPAQAQNNLVQAQAGLALAQAQLAQAQSPPVSASVAAAQAAVTQAQAQVGVVQAEIAQDTVTAPFAGVVTGVPGVVGQTATPGTPVVTLAGNQLTVQAPLPQQDVSMVRTGAAATITVPGGSQSLIGSVSSIAPAANPSSLSFTLTVAPASLPSWLHPGESAAVTVTTASYPAAVLVPASAIVNITGASQVFVVHANHTVSLQTVVPSVSDGTTTMVSGISAGTKVVTLGQTYLANGDKVRVTATASVPAAVTGSSVAGLLTGAPVTGTAGTTTGRGGGAGGGGAAATGAGG